MTLFPYGKLVPSLLSTTKIVNHIILNFYWWNLKTVWSVVCGLINTIFYLYHIIPVLGSSSVGILICGLYLQFTHPFTKSELIASYFKTTRTQATQHVSIFTTFHHSARNVLLFASPVIMKLWQMFIYPQLEREVSCFREYHTMLIIKHW